MSDNTILSKLEGIKTKYETIAAQITDPEVMSDMKRYVQLNKEYKELGPVVEASERYRLAVSNLELAKEIVANEKDEEMREMAKGEIEELEPQIERLEEDMPYWRYAAVPAATKRPYSPATCCECTPVISKRGDGVSRPLPSARALPAAIRR